MTPLQPRLIIGLGNPLLDISATDVSQATLDKYDLKMDNAILAEEKHLPLYQELVDNYTIEYIAGGATQNSIRVAQWILRKFERPNATAFLGCVGQDPFGEQLRACATRDGVLAHYLVDPTLATGTCGVLVRDGERSLVANLAAANAYTLAHLTETSDVQTLITRPHNIVYSAGFHLTVCPDAMAHLGEDASAQGKIFCFNLSAPFIIEFFREPLMRILDYADYVFGNENEAAALGKAMGWGSDDLEAIALKLARLGKRSGAHPRTVVFTQGPKHTIVARENRIRTFAVDALDASELVDTNGAGDAFVGGFLSQLYLEKDLHECVRAGHWASQQIIRRSGCTFPEDCAFI